jgi:hypothetical protein
MSAAAIALKLQALSTFQALRLLRPTRQRGANQPYKMPARVAKLAAVAVVRAELVRQAHDHLGLRYVDIAARMGVCRERVQQLYRLSKRQTLFTPRAPAMSARKNAKRD